MENVNINPKLKEYIENNIFKEYSKNEKGHSLEHIKYVIRRSFEIAEQNDLRLDANMMYTIAAFHDIGHHIDAKRHEIISAEIFEKDENMKEFFNADEIKIIKEAIEDHRASSDHEPRTIYGKVVSSADRNNTVDECLKRSYYYGKRLMPNATDMELYERAYNHLKEKFGENGYAKFFFKDREYEEFLASIRAVLKDKDSFIKMQENYIKKLENR